MRKTAPGLILALLMALMSQNAFALDAEKCGKPRGRFTNFSFAYSHLDQEGYPKLHSDIGFALTKGNTYYLHKPIAGCLRFGIDAVWADITYDNYKVNEYDRLGMLNDFSIYHVDLGMQVGPSATVNLFRRFQVSAYFRYNPTLSMMYNNDEIQVGLSNMFTGGASVSYGIIGLGIEARFGQSKIKSYFDNSDNINFSDSDEWTDVVGSRKLTTKFSGLRAYISLRF